MIIMSKQCGNCGSNLAYGKRTRLCSFASRGCVWSDRRYPITLRSRDPVVMTLPIYRPGATPMVGGYNKSCFVTILGHYLDHRPKASQKIVHMIGSREVMIITSCVCPFIRFAKTD